MKYLLVFLFVNWLTPPSYAGLLITGSTGTGYSAEVYRLLYQTLIEEKLINKASLHIEDIRERNGSWTLYLRADGAQMFAYSYSIPRIKYALRPKSLVEIIVSRLVNQEIVFYDNGSS